MKKFIKKLKKIGLLAPLFFVILPTSPNYQLRSYDMGSGGTDIGSTSPNYSMDAILGTQNNQGSTSPNYNVNPGLLFVQEANTPSAPTWVNSDNWYNKLHVTINTSSNPTDATYAIAISDDDWATTDWVQDDNTVGDSLGIEDFQTYAAWGGASGEDVIGLSNNTNYKIKVKARHGNFTESPLGPEASASTVDLSLVFDIDVSSSDTETGPPYQIAFGDLTAGSVSTATDKIWIDLETNAEYGGFVYIYSSNSGLKSDNLGYTISALTGNLTSQSEGFGVRSDSVGQSGGGPLAVESPYDGADENVGILDTTVRKIYNSSNSPIAAGRGSALLKAKISAITPSSSDYTDTLTIIAAASF